MAATALDSDGVSTMIRCWYGERRERVPARLPGLTRAEHGKMVERVFLGGEGYMLR